MASRREKLEAMLADDPQDAMLRYMLALEFEKEADHERSLQLFEALMSNDPAYVPAFLMAGQQLAKLGRIDEAKSAYRRGIEQARLQGNDHASGEMGAFLVELGDE
ncbi:MAG: hypothetical protein WAO83_25465 [Fuerstiella sp.]|jgi:tetratricopeptide (TPR) repeat protein